MTFLKLFQKVNGSTKSYLKLISWLTLAIFSLLPYHASAQENGTQDARYKIEVIVFESMALKGWTEEYWPAEIDHPVIDRSTPVYVKDKAPLWLSLQDRDMNSHAAKLNKRGYRVLFHQAWSQLAPGTAKAPTVLIENESQYGTSLVGTVRLYKTRFAHVDFDLEFNRRIPEKVLNEFLQHQRFTGENSLSAANIPNSWAFHLADSRKIKPGELHYIDHPLFGILVQITSLN